MLYSGLPAIAPSWVGHPVRPSYGQKAQGCYRAPGAHRRPGVPTQNEPRCRHASPAPGAYADVTIFYQEEHHQDPTLELSAPPVVRYIRLVSVVETSYTYSG